MKLIDASLSDEIPAWTLGWRLWTFSNNTNMIIMMIILMRIIITIKYDNEIMLIKNNHDKIIIG